MSKGNLIYCINNHGDTKNLIAAVCSSIKNWKNAFLNLADKLSTVDLSKINSDVVYYKFFVNLRHIINNNCVESWGKEFTYTFNLNNDLIFINEWVQKHLIFEQDEMFRMFLVLCPSNSQFGILADNGIDISNVENNTTIFYNYLTTIDSISTEYKNWFKIEDEYICNYPILIYPTNHNRVQSIDYGMTNLDGGDPQVGLVESDGYFFWNLNCFNFIWQ